MKRHFISVLFISIVIISCEKGSDNLIIKNKIEVSNFIDTTILASDTLKYSFGYFGDEEGISILYDTKNSESCELLHKQSDERILQYVPQKDFLGMDSVFVVTMRGSHGASRSTDIDTTLMLIKVVKDNFHKKLIGKWNWISSCGGYTGGCWYPDKDYHELIEFDYNMRYIEKINDSIIHDLQYNFSDSFVSGSDTVYKIGFGNEYVNYCRFAGEKLKVSVGDFWKEYERIE
jgi:hypothetical protein